MISACLLLLQAWRLLFERYPKAAAQMLAAVPEEYRLNSTGFTKVTVAIDNPTPIHYDGQPAPSRTIWTHRYGEGLVLTGGTRPADQNFGVTFLLSFELDEAGRLVGGSHVLCGSDDGTTVIVLDNPNGVIYMGDYRRVLHANAATRGNGRRFILTAYCSKSLVDLVKKRLLLACITPSPAGLCILRLPHRHFSCVAALPTQHSPACRLPTSAATPWRRTGLPGRVSRSSLLRPRPNKFQSLRPTLARPFVRCAETF